LTSPPPTRIEMPLAARSDRAAEVRLRYAWLSEILKGVIQKPERPVITFSDRLDAFLTHKLYGALFLILVLYVVFQSIFRWAKPLMDGIAAGFGELSDFVGQWLPEGALRSLITDGVIAGAGGVLVFVPQVLILFAFIAILEDCGYLARAAFMMDRLMRT